MKGTFATVCKTAKVRDRIRVSCEFDSLNSHFPGDSVLNPHENLLLQDMKPVPLLLLLSSVLLSSHLRPAAGRPRILPGWLDGSGRLQTQRLDETLLRAAAAAAGDSTAPGLLGDNILRFLQRRNPDPLRLLPLEDESQEEAVRTAVQLLKRSEEPPLSIDLTFHLLRNMIQMAKMESQREQAHLNRKVLDEVGK